MVTKDFAELFACFNARGVRAVVVGGYAGRVAGHYGEHAVSYLGLEELRRNKRASGRPQDLADLETLG